MPVTGTQPRIPLSAGAQRTNLTSAGLLKILRRTDSAIRDDGHWYVDPERIDQIAAARQVLGLAGAPTIDQIAAARQVLGLDHNTGATTKEKF